MKIVFCFTTILRNSHRAIFDIDKLIQEGYNIIFLDLTELHQGNPTYDDPMIHKLVCKCKNLEEVVHFVEDNKDSEILYICNDVHLSNAYSTFKRLITKKDVVLAYSTKTIPGQESNLVGKRDFLKKIIASKFYHPFLSKKIYSFFRSYHIPDYFLTNTKFCLSQKVMLTVPKKRIFNVHSDDVNSIMKIQEDKQVLDSSKRIGVFLDQLLPIAYKNRTPGHYLDEYYKKLENILVLLKDRLKLDEIIIAKHPETKVYEDILKDKLNLFPGNIGKTHELINSADIVFAHFSTSIGIAAYLKKPVILLEDEVLLKVKKIKNSMDAISKELNLIRVGMDDKVGFPEYLIKIDNEAYQRYVEKYMKDSDIYMNSFHYAVKLILANKNGVNV